MIWAILKFIFIMSLGISLIAARVHFDQPENKILEEPRKNLIGDGKEMADKY